MVMVASSGCRRARSATTTSSTRRTTRNYRPTTIRSSTRPTTVLPTLLPRHRIPSDRWPRLVGADIQRIHRRGNQTGRADRRRDSTAVASDIHARCRLALPSHIPDPGASRWHRRRLDHCRRRLRRTAQTAPITLLVRLASASTDTGNRLRRRLRHPRINAVTKQQ